MSDLADANEGDKATAFQALQGRLRECWQPIDPVDLAPRQILVVPSLSLDQEELMKVEGVHHYEERLLFSLIHLRHPKTKLVYVTSQPLHPSIVDYYLELLPGIPSSHAKDRLTLFATYDASRQPLTAKILARPRLIERIRAELTVDQAYMTCYNATHLEQALSLALGIPLMAVAPNLLYWGTKSGSRQIFAECGILHPDGSPLMHTVDDLAAVTAQLWERQPSLKRVVIKLNEGFSGEGNALLDLRSLPTHPSQSTHAQRVTAIKAGFADLKFQCVSETWANFSKKVTELGAIAEAFIEGEIKRSPSVQGQITPYGEVEILSTHDQLLGGPDGQIFLGCTFPADERYRLALQAIGQKVGQNLAAKGALERYSVDFIAVYEPETSQTETDAPAASKSTLAANPWQIYAIEINLRKGGTTHPMMALKLLTDGIFCLEDGLFYTHRGQPKFYRASDNLQKPAYRGILPNDLMDIIVGKQLHFNAIEGVGAAFHLMGCLSEYGKLGLTCIGNTPTEADAIYDRVVAALDQDASNPAC